MSSRRLPSTKLILVFLLASGIAGLSLGDETAGYYTPVAPPKATLTALRAQVQLVQNWLDDKDLASAAQAAQGLVLLADILGYQGSDADWQKRADGLRRRSSSLLDAVKKKDGAGSANLVKQCSAQLDELAKNGLAGRKTVTSGFKPPGSTKDWMLLMEGAYIDAKSAKTASELEPFAQAIAEEVNVTGWLRADPKWRSRAQDVCAQALKVAGLARDNKLVEAKKALKEVYQRCEICHGHYQQK